MKLGKLPPTKDKRDLKFAAFRKREFLPICPPRRFGNERLVTDPWGILGNDGAGCCVFSGCHDANTEVLTAHGWKRWPDYNGTDLLATMSQITGDLEFQAPLAVQRYDYDDRMYFSNHRSVDFCLTPNHRIWHKPYTSTTLGSRSKRICLWGDSKFTTIDSLRSRVLLPNATSGFQGIELETIKIGDRVWDGDDFMRLLGLMLSDGWIESGWDRLHRLAFCHYKELRMDAIRALAARLDINEDRILAGNWRWSDRAFADWMRANAYVGTVYRSPFKRVPDIVKSCCPKQINLFLEFFGDKHSRNDKDVFYSASKWLIDDLQELLLRVGKRGKLAKRERRDGGFVRGRQIMGHHPEYSLAVKTSPLWLHSGGRDNDLATDHYRGEVFCATVPNSTLVTRRNGDLLISGNSAHEHMVWCASVGTKTTFTDKAVLRAYSDVTGYVPGNEATDQGTEVREALKYRRDTGILDSKGTAHKIGAFVKLEPGNTEHLLEALYLFGAVGIGIRFPESAWAQFDAGIPWRIVSGSAIEGGHYIPLVARRYRLVCVTWGKLQEMTLGFYRKHADEAWGILSEDMLKEGKTIHGFDLPALNDALQAVGSEAPQ